MNILSCFDGMSCARIALDRLGIPVTNYFASEIDRYAIQTSKANWHDITHIGDVTKVHYFEGVLYTEFGSYEVNFSGGLICGGSPCQGFSFAGKQLNFEDPRSKLFFEFVRIYEEIKAEHPTVKVFLENVLMKKEYQAVISEKLALTPVLINSALVSAQNRKRLYRTDIPFQGQPKDRGILLKHILEYEVDNKYALSEAGLHRGLTKKYSSPKFDPDKTGTLNTKNNSGQLSIDSGTTFVSVDQDDKSLTLTAGYHFNPSDKEYLIDRRKQKDSLIKLGNVHPSSRSMNGEIYSIEGKSPTCTTNKGEGSKIGVVHYPASIIGRKLNENGKRDDYNPDVPITQCLQVKHSADKTGCLTTVDKDNVVSTMPPGRYEDVYNTPHITYRKLTVTECERLQGVPDGYCQRLSAEKKQVSNSQSYKMLGNGWQVDTIVHLFEPLLWMDII